MPITRCQWACASPLEQQYHDTEWGVPLHDERKLFELCVLVCIIPAWIAKMLLSG